jgi:glycosyltransferase involved in cell wall biosynthesis
MDQPAPRIAFSWQGLPQYAARQLAAAIQQLGVACTVVGTRPQVPIEGMEACLGQKIHWLESDRPKTWKELGLEVPQFFFQAGWSCPAINALGDEVRAQRGKVCLLMDNQWRGDLRQLLGGLWFRCFRRQSFQAIMVPGASGVQLAKWYGFKADEIFQGLYGADPKLFYSDQSLSQRPKRILFVGQYIERKGCVPLAQAFAAVADQLPGWELVLCGSGPLQSQFPQHPQVKVRGFVQPEALGALYRDARIFALPSHQEAWGLVVHEAALSGCQLLLSDQIGAAIDFATPKNAALFQAGKVADLSQAILKLAKTSGDALTEAQTISLQKAQSHSPAIFGQQVVQIVKSFN